jgi:transposase
VTAHCCKRLFDIKSRTGVVLLQDNATHNRPRGVQNLVQRRGWEVLKLPPYSLVSSHVSAGYLNV